MHNQVIAGTPLSALNSVSRVQLFHLIACVAVGILAQSLPKSQEFQPASYHRKVLDFLPAQCIIPRKIFTKIERRYHREISSAVCVGYFKELVKPFHLNNSAYDVITRWFIFSTLSGIK